MWCDAGGVRAVSRWWSEAKPPEIRINTGLPPQRGGRIRCVHCSRLELRAELGGNEVGPRGREVWIVGHGFILLPSTGKSDLPVFPRHFPIWKIGRRIWKPSFPVCGRIARFRAALPFET